MISKVQRILILGGGFGGLYAALRLEKIFSGDESIEITLISDENFLLFTPMLPEVPSGSIEAKHIVSPLRAFFRKVRFKMRKWSRLIWRHALWLLYIVASVGHADWSSTIWCWLWGQQRSSMGCRGSPRTLSR